MKGRRRTFRVLTKGLNRGYPRVCEDVEFHHACASMKDEDGPGGRPKEEILEECRCWLANKEDWQLGVMALRLRFTLGMLRYEIGRRERLDPNQLRLAKGL